MPEMTVILDSIDIVSRGVCVRCLSVYFILKIQKHSKQRFVRSMPNRIPLKYMCKEEDFFI